MAVREGVGKENVRWGKTVKDFPEARAALCYLQGAGLEPASGRGIGHVLGSVEDSAKLLTSLKANWRGHLCNILFCSGGTKSLNGYQTQSGRNPTLEGILEGTYVLFAANV